ncbi:UDP-glycosyltransferase [Actinidia chinensis var. chinensis]|uniref:Glycosyltransferase n=1 Tax=Actinidia chinensis var. chinensis TaxID=1590841 RepID=A0A2R6R1Z5_ACTCC|nr:UDP-glycosyltransferase [Actinidia chinensis var. chinensis]
MENKEETHVLMVAFSSQGHINPMLRLAKRLISRGLHVTLATTDVARHRMLSSSSATSTAVAAGSVAGIRLEFFSDGFALDYDRKANLDLFMDSFSRVGPKNLSSIIYNQNSKFKCIITNPFVPWAADVAEEHGIPCALLWIQPCALYSIYYRFYNSLDPFPNIKNPNSWVELPGLPIMKTEDLPTFVLPSNPLGSITKLFSDLLQNVKKFKWVLANSFEELENDVIGSMSGTHPVRAIGPLVPPELLGEDRAVDAGIEMWKSADDCIDWLDQRENCSVIYVSFGSIAVLSEKQMGAIATALRNSKRPFLWVVKPPDYKAEDGGGWREMLEIFEEIKAQGLIVPWSPQIKVLMHPSVGCFLSHCGWNSTLETIAAGVPVVAYPQWSDQPTNAKLLENVWRVGVRVSSDPDGVVTGAEVERCIEAVMSGPSAAEFRKNAAELKVAARGAVAGGGSSNRNIQMFVDEIIGGSRIQ